MILRGTRIITGDGIIEDGWVRLNGEHLYASLVRDVFTAVPGRTALVSDAISASAARCVIENVVREPQFL